MALIVQKYGGTSVGSVERINLVADRILKTKRQGNDLVVVVSAMSGETDRLIRLSQEISSFPDPRELDRLLSTGEQVTIALLVMALHERGLSARSFTGRQIGLLTDDAHTNARIEKVAAEHLKEALAEGIIPVVAGFQGVNARSDITTLGRGGSDTTAVAVAATLSADLCDIYTDVDGVYTADPNIVSAARKLSMISYEEMLELASLGAKVLNARSVEFAMKYQVALRVRSSFNDNEGTLITKEGPEMEQEIVSGVAYDKNQAKVTLVGVPDQPGIASQIFSAVAKENILVDMIIQNVGQEGMTDISFTVPRGDARRAKEVLSKGVDALGVSEILVTENIAKVSVVGVGMRSHSGVAAQMFEGLASEGINIMMISTSEIKVSCIIDAKYTELAVRTLHERFGLEAVRLSRLAKRPRKTTPKTKKAHAIR